MIREPKYVKITRLLNVELEKTPHFEYRKKFFHRDEPMKRYFVANMDMNLKAVYISRIPGSYDRATKFSNNGSRHKRLTFYKATIVLFMQNGKIVEITDDGHPFIHVFLNGRDEWKNKPPVKS